MKIKFGKCNVCGSHELTVNFNNCKYHLFVTLFSLSPNENCHSRFSFHPSSSSATINQCKTDVNKSTPFRSLEDLFERHHQLFFLGIIPTNYSLSSCCLWSHVLDASCPSFQWCGFALLWMPLSKGLLMNVMMEIFSGETSSSYVSTSA